MESITRKEAGAFLKTYELIQEYIQEVVKIAEASPVGLTDEARAIDKQLQGMYDSPEFGSFKDKARAIAGKKDWKFGSIPPQAKTNPRKRRR